jgi:hypothetical protein
MHPHNTYCGIVDCNVMYSCKWLSVFESVCVLSPSSE